LRDYIPEIHKRGAEIAIIGNGSAAFASAFREEFELTCPLLVDPELRAYRAAGLRRGRVEILSPKVPLHGLRAFLGGARQHGVQGDPWQLGGVFVIRPGGRLAYRYVSGEAGDHAPVQAILAALEREDDDVLEHDEGAMLPALAGRALSLLVDPTIALSFDRTGYAIHSLTFDDRDLDVDMTGKRCLITGANGGLGYETALGLADLGASVFLLCRDAGRGEQAAARIRDQTGNRAVTAEVVDMASLGSVRAAGDRLGAAPVDVLVHNAGVLPDARIVTDEGLESTFATHVVGPFLLTKLLRPALQRAAQARVIWVSSGGMYTKKLQTADPNWRERSYDGVSAYAETKRAQVVLAELWAEVFDSTPVTVNAMHPGWADTPGVRSSLPSFFRIMRSRLRTPAEGADTILWLAVSARAANYDGRFFFDRAPRLTHLLPLTRESEYDRHQLWMLCEDLTKR